MIAKGFAPCPVPLLYSGLRFRRNSSTRPDGSCVDERRSFSCDNAHVWCCSCMTIHRPPTSQPGSTSRCIPIRFVTGGVGGRRVIFPCTTNPVVGASPLFFPLDHAVVKAIACETVFESRAPLSRQSLADITSRASQSLGRTISRSTVWRILHRDAIKPWQYEYWIYPRDPCFAERAGPIIDLYAGHWYGESLGKNDYIISSDEKTSIQARIRCHPTHVPAPGLRRRLEFEYERGGALQYLAAWDVRRGYVMGRCESCTGIEPFGRLVRQVMEQEPYRSANRVFWIVDNGSSHRGGISKDRLKEAFPNAILLHTPVHASWLNQVEIYFSLIQRKVLTPNDFTSLAEVEQRLRLYEELSNRSPRPFAWRFDRTKLREFLMRLESRRPLAAAA